MTFRPQSVSELRREWDLNPRGACTPKAFRGLRRLCLGIGCTLPEQDSCDGRLAPRGLDRPESARNYGQVYGHPSSVTLQAAEYEPEHFDGPRERRPLDRVVVVSEKCADSCSARST
jgi:hypothetical protein